MSDPSLKKVFHVRLAHVRPLPHSEMKKASPHAKGAFLDCIVAATQPTQALAVVKAALSQDGYEFLEYDEILEFSESSWEEREAELTFKGLAWEALFDDKVGYGPFHCYERLEEPGLHRPGPRRKQNT